MDLLGDILSTLELSSTICFRAELTAPFSIAVPENRQVAASAAMSKTVVAERFRAALGMTPARDVAAWRMHEARALLDRTTRSIRDIAWDVGCESAAAFNRVFDEHFGAPPGRCLRGGDAAAG